MTSDTDASKKLSLTGLPASQIEEHLKLLGEPAYRARQIYNWIHHRKVESFEEMTDLSKLLRKRLSDRYLLRTIVLEKKNTALDGTEKYLWKLSDHRFVESVVIPEARRNTVCISSQVGCSLGCSFCATGSMGLIRNLTAGEIVEQVLQVRKLSEHKITNVVFMGMGEPFINYRRSIQASQIMGDPQGLAIATKKITISTSGVVPKIYQYTDDGHPFGLAISLHAPNQSLREQIMPIAGKFPLDELMASITHYMRAKKRNRVTFEYVLLHGVNDTASEARQLISLLSPIRCKLNVIPCNQNYLGFSPPPPEHLEKFVSILMNAPFTVTVRKNRGEDITAACGQLAVEHQEKSIYIR
ncbi:MAG: 23S rRNA (adenine(2503)-C(2))-methyltransferase RlmN [Calditrichaeota bacterium]|nr:23S rRNA (adenine(2503)-C(2))-methyltransferase RlmN [Calditrichota bacterium]RQV99581.1 MAG: 23S rRNA (adenine(2503)-C(2))-methyltransferase RlmN [Calditrichota bacterium]